MLAFDGNQRHSWTMKHRYIFALVAMFIAACAADVAPDGSEDALPNDTLGMGESALVPRMCPICPPLPEPQSCYTCADLVMLGGDARRLCDGEQPKFFNVWECVINAPQCGMCQAPGYPYTVFTPYALTSDCQSCLFVNGCADELSPCGGGVIANPG